MRVELPGCWFRFVEGKYLFFLTYSTGVIDLLGGASGLVEFKASLLASHGFTALALAYMGFDDLPEFPTVMDMDYFEEAANWLSHHPKVIPHGIGVHAICLGSWIALLMASLKMKAVKTVVAISPSITAGSLPFKYKGKISSGKAFDNQQKVAIPEGAILRYGHSVVTSHKTPVPVCPVEDISCPVLMVYGTDDLLIPPEFSVRYTCNALRKIGREHLCSVLCYWNAGHLIEPPYTPHCYSCYMHHFGKWQGHQYLVWGGEMKCHARAQEDAWPKILTFLQKHLETVKCKL